MWETCFSGENHRPMYHIGQNTQPLWALHTTEKKTVQSINAIILIYEQCNEVSLWSLIMYWFQLTKHFCTRLQDYIFFEEFNYSLIKQVSVSRPLIRVTGYYIAHFWASQTYCIEKIISSRFSKNTEENVSEFLEN